MTGIVTAYTMGAPVGWQVWELGQGEELADLAASKAADGPEAQARVREAVLGLEAACAGLKSVVVGGLWFPDRSTGVSTAVARLELLTTADGSEAQYDTYLATAQAYRAQRGVKVFDRAVAPVTIDAGPAFVEITVLAERRGGLFSRSAEPVPVETHVQYSIFPPGSSNVLQLALVTTQSDLLDALGEAGRAMAASLTLTVEPGPR
jgi:hypothetical protein